ncbi:uncharacterized protein LOC132697729 [Cylas formicarius]|uniref:uncharacterized protein LOC132697729 n=1 Tax=Cylas formicarius TaxID=197179 RepID=UPI00295864BA|nr:uncharacterized protein LOC132697729 [Cylas formicarius]
MVVEEVDLAVTIVDLAATEAKVVVLVAAMMAVSKVATGVMEIIKGVVVGVVTAGDKVVDLAAVTETAKAADLGVTATMVTIKAGINLMVIKNNYVVLYNKCFLCF